MGGYAHAGVLDGKPIVVKDPYFGEVLYDFYNNRFPSAITKLLVGIDQGRFPHHAEDANLLLGGLYLSYGLHLEAESLFNQIMKKGAAQEVRDRAWLSIGRIRYEKGLPEEAIRALEEVGKKNLPDDVKFDVNMQMANLLINKNELGQAVDLLKDLPNQEGKETYARYNLGVALYRNGQQIEGAEQLDKVGQVPSTDPVIQALRDKANLALGYAVLVGGDPLKAKAYFHRVRLNGPFSNKALLGFGWSSALLNDYKSALTPWLELNKRDRTDAAVYESFLAVPYALEQLKALAQALYAYQNAIAVFDNELINVNVAIKAVRDGRLWENMVAQLSRAESRRSWALEDLPADVEARYFTNIIATHRFQEAIKNLLDLRYLRDDMSRWARDIPVYQDMVRLRQATYDERIPQLMPDEGLYKLASLRDERDLYAEELDNILRRKNLKALANGKELKQIDRLNDVKDLLVRAENQIDAGQYEEMRRKYFFLRGILEWNVGSTIGPRVWTIRKNLLDLDQALKETNRQAESITEARKNAPTNFGRRLDYITGLSNRITTLQGQVDVLYKDQQQQLEAMVIEELSWLKQRLEGYTDQARYGMARLQDLGSRDPAPEPAAPKVDTPAPVTDPTPVAPTEQPGAQP